MIADALDGQPRSLAQYAEELRAKIAKQEARVARHTDYSLFEQSMLARLREKLLAVEREINWRMGI